ncbi:MAG: hypothetical protein LBP62_04815 [Clostridiales bacterium]|jgi:UDP-N-acetylmuramyl pentapeptide synthase|nr:hypothetical protein [Clostridiales bacterium]
MILLPFIGALFMSVISYNYMHYLQLNNYSAPGTLKNFAKKHWAEMIFLFILSAFAAVIRVFWAEGFYAAVIFTGYVLSAAAFVLTRNKIRKKNIKKPLAPTARMRRQFAFAFCFNLFVFYIIYITCAIKFYAVFSYVIFGIYTADFSISSVIIGAFENINNKRYIKNAEKRLSAYPNAVKIGITGSYGKTSVKNILKAMTEKKYVVIATEKNYNTPLGTAISSELIGENTQIFIAEMGARRVGEIDELCRIVKPDCGIITGITSQHTETFKSLENIISTKFELYRSVESAGGFCVFNYDDANIREAVREKADNIILSGTCKDGVLISADDANIREAKRGKTDNIILSGTDGGGIHCYAADISASAEGSGFTLFFDPKIRGKVSQSIRNRLKIKEGEKSESINFSECGDIPNAGEKGESTSLFRGSDMPNTGKKGESINLSECKDIPNADKKREFEKIAVSTRLIGRANIINITVAAAAAYALGVSPKEIGEAAAELKPVPHRTEVIKSGGLTIIDDTYNSNPAGAAAALNTLAMFSGRRAVVACGFAEQGKNLAAANGEFGKKIAETAELAVLIGAGARYILNGMRAAGFDEKKVFLYPSLAEAKKDFSRLFKNGDVILFENDMPDDKE